jgi:nucleotide-binding universal stress UspA family protein
MKIVLAVDGSEHSDLALESVAARPWPPGSAVRVLHVIPPLAFAAPLAEQGIALSAAPTGPYWPPALMDARNELQQQAEQLVQKIAQQLEANKTLEVDIRIREGDARSEIVSEAADWEADMIVVGSHGYTGIKRWLLGSVAHSIVSHAPCSVEVVRRRTPKA